MFLQETGSTLQAFQLIFWLAAIMQTADKPLNLALGQSVDNINAKLPQICGLPYSRNSIYWMIGISLLAGQFSSHVESFQLTYRNVFS